MSFSPSARLSSLYVYLIEANSRVESAIDTAILWMKWKQQYDSLISKHMVALIHSSAVSVQSKLDWVAQSPNSIVSRKFSWLCRKLYLFFADFAVFHLNRNVCRLSDTVWTIRFETNVLWLIPFRFADQRVQVHMPQTQKNSKINAILCSHDISNNRFIWLFFLFIRFSSDCGFSSSSFRVQRFSATTAAKKTNVLISFSLSSSPSSSTLHRRVRYSCVQFGFYDWIEYTTSTEPVNKIC